MAYFSTPRPTTFSARISARLTSVFGAPNRAYADWSRTRTTQKALSSLSDSQLEDIGMTRRDIANL